MKRLLLIGALALAGASLWAHGVKEYAAIAEDVAVIAGDAQDLYQDLVTDKGVHAATADLVDAWGHLKAAVAVLRHGHDGRAAVAVKELSEAVTRVRAAYEALATDPNVADAGNRVLDIAARTADVVHVLRGGNVGESCASRCDHECGGLDVAACILNCSNHNCHPSCCGCKDGTPGCDGCGASCGQGTACAPADQVLG